MRKGGARAGAKVAEADGTQCNGCGSTFSLFNWKVRTAKDAGMLDAGSMGR